MSLDERESIDVDGPCSEGGELDGSKVIVPVDPETPAHTFVVSGILAEIEVALAEGGAHQ